MKKERIILLVLAAIQFTHVLDFMIMMPFNERFKESFHTTPKEFSFLLSSYMIAATITGIISSLYLDKFDRKKVLVFTYSFFTVGTLLCGYTYSYSSFMIARTLTGCFAGIVGATILTIIGDLIPSERRASAVGMVMAAFSIASILGVPIGLWIAEVSSWHMTFVFLGGVSAIILLLIIKFIPNITAHISGAKSHSSFQHLKDILKERSHLIALLFYFVLIVGQFVIIPMIAQYMELNVGMETTDIKYIYLLGGLCTTFTSPYIGKLSDKYGKQRVFIIAGVLSLIPIYIITNLEQVSLLAALIINCIFFITVTSRMVPATTMMTGMVKPRYRGSFMSLSVAVRELAAATGALIAGQIIFSSADGSYLIGYNVVGYIATAFSVVAIFLSLKIKSEN